MTQNSPRRIEVVGIPQTAPVRPPTGPGGGRTPRSSLVGCPRCAALMADRARHEAWHAEQDAQMQKALADLAAVRRWAQGVVADLSRLASFPITGSGPASGDITNDGKEAGHE
ncbi:hypothetical protein [Nocardia fusca]|uniref:C2H2-type domain-containing protein n=1 Tax=Nocardia fusca TaxID=941183 RepID=A0ABV3FIP8_9NOCA